MFLIFLLQSIDQGNAPVVDESIHREVQSILCNNDIAYSTNPLDMIRKTHKKCNEEMTKLMFKVPQTDEIRERVKILTKRSQNLQVSCHEVFNYNICSFMVLYFVLFYVMN